MIDAAVLKRKVAALVAALAAGAPVAEIYHPDAELFAGHPLGRLEGRDQIDRFWARIRTALPDLERRDLIFLGGENRPDPRVTGPRAPHLVAAMGHLQATFSAPLLDIPATGGVIQLRYCEAHWLDGDRIRQSHVMVDWLDLMRQAGVFPLPPSFGAEGAWLGPATVDGVRIDSAPWSGPDALDTVLAMHSALLAFDGKSLESMPHEAFWTDAFMYYAASGIGTCRGLTGFRAHHQIPFLKAFPDRSGLGHFIRIADGPYAVTGGSVAGTHLGPFLGMTATGRRIEIPVMDFYRLDGSRIAENWLPMDVPHVAQQMGNDLFARMRHYAGDPALDLT